MPKSTAGITILLNIAVYNNNMQHCAA